MAVERDTDVSLLSTFSQESFAYAKPHLDEGDWRFFERLHVVLPIDIVRQLIDRAHDIALGKRSSDPAPEG